MSDLDRIGYELGHISPNYTVPAIPLAVDVYPSMVNHEFYNSIVIYRVEEYCPCCGRPTSGPIMALFDFEPERAKISFIPCGEYVNERQLIEATEAFREFTAVTGKIQ